MHGLGYLHDRHRLNFNYKCLNARSPCCDCSRSKTPGRHAEMNAEKRTRARNVVERSNAGSDHGSVASNTEWIAGTHSPCEGGFCKIPLGGGPWPPAGGERSDGSPMSPPCRDEGIDCNGNVSPLPKRLLEFCCCCCTIATSRALTSASSHS